MAKRMFVMKGHDLDHKFKAAGSYLSEKLDGMRCLWLPETKGKNVGWNDKIGTGLWSTYGKPIFAPDWFTAGLPEFPLDGELFAGRGRFDEVTSACKKHVPIEEEWAKITYQVFDIPSYMELYKPGHVKNAHMDYKFPVGATIPINNWTHPKRFNVNYAFLKLFKFADHVKLVKQIEVPFSFDEADKFVDQKFNETIDLGGEGIMLRQPWSFWEGLQSRALAKIKPELDAEGTIVGFTDAEPGSKYDGLVGALVLKLSNGAEMKLSGMNDSDRTPGAFKLGQVVTFKYTEVTKTGIPRHARFWRLRQEVV